MGSIMNERRPPGATDSMPKPIIPGNEMPPIYTALPIGHLNYLRCSSAPSTRRFADARNRSDRRACKILSQAALVLGLGAEQAA